MKLAKLRLLRQHFKEHLQAQTHYDNAFKWECQENFLRNWNLEAVDFAEMFNRSLSHPRSGSLWGGSHQSAKSVMLSFIGLNQEFVRAMFRDLFSEQKDLNMRIERFHFHCDQLLEQLMVKDRKINHHHHHDFYMPTLYLSLRFPQQYCVYEGKTFSQCLRIIEAKDPFSVTLNRFIKVTPILQSQLLQDEEFLPLLRKKIQLRDQTLYTSRWLTYEFYHFIAVQG